MDNDTEKMVLPGSQAIKSLLHGTRMRIEVHTPIGSKINFTTTLIGSDNRSYLFYDLPVNLLRQYQEFLEPNFRVEVKGVPDNAGGVLQRFQTKIEHIIETPVSVLLLSIPAQVNLFSLRNEIRFAIEQECYIRLATRNVNVTLIDISSNGCAFCFSSIGLNFETDQRVTLEITNPSNKDLFSVSGVIKSIKSHHAINTCGVELDDPGKVNAERLINQLSFDGVKYAFSAP